LLLLPVAGVAGVPAVTETTLDFSKHGSDWFQANCGSRRQQSPVNFNEVAEPPEDFFSYLYPDVGKHHAKLVNDGRIITLALPGMGRFGGIRIPNSQEGWFDLKHIDVRTPSEHTIRGKHAAVELQLVHEARERVGSKTDLVTVSILLNPLPPPPVVPSIGSDSFLQRRGASLSSAKQQLHSQSPMVQELIDDFGFGNLPLAGDHAYATNMRPLPLNTLLQNGSFFMYQGSETLPPCDEKMIWLVRREPLVALHSQVDSLRARINATTGGAGNYRTVMPLNQREIKTWMARLLEAPTTTTSPLAAATASLMKSQQQAREALALAKAAGNQADGLGQKIDQFYSEQVTTTQAPGSEAAAAELKRAIGDAVEQDLVPAAQVLAKSYVSQELVRQRTSSPTFLH
jgi:carbonic anhydrase